MVVALFNSDHRKLQNIFSEVYKKSLLIVYTACMNWSRGHVSILYRAMQ